MSESQKNILVSAIKIRVSRGEDVETVIARFTKLTDVEKYEILSVVKE